MEKLIRTQEILHVVWDNRDETLEEIKNEMLSKIEMNENFQVSVGRCYNEKTKNHDSEIIFISEKGFGTSSSFYRIGDHIVLDCSTLDQYNLPHTKYSIRGYNNEQFKRFYGDLIK